MSLQDWNTFFNFSSAVLLGLTFAIGAGAVITGHLVNQRQQERIARAQQGASDAAAKAAEAQKGADAANLAAAKAQAVTATLEIEAAKQREKATQAETALLELQARLAWR